MSGEAPESFDRLWQSLEPRHGKQPGTRTMIELLQEGTGRGWNRLRNAVKQALHWYGVKPSTFISDLNYWCTMEYHTKSSRHTKAIKPTPLAIAISNFFRRWR